MHHLIAASGLIALACIYLWCRFAREVPVLMYHRVCECQDDGLSLPPTVFAKQMDYLQKHGFHTVTLAALQAHLTIGAKLPRRPVVLTFDDGYEDNFTNALPVLKERGMTATVFVITDWLGKTNDFEDHPGKPSHRMMNEEQLRGWQDAGLEIGSHTVTHPWLSRLSDDAIRRELSVSKEAIEKLFGVDELFLCYPYGDFDDRVRRTAISAGYSGALAIHKGTTIWRNDLYALRRAGISSRKKLADFALKVSTLHIVNIGLHSR